MPKHPLRDIWSAMVQKCHNPRHWLYAKYGGAGVAVCDEWRSSVEAFASHVGPKPPGTSLERIDPSKGFEPGNVLWAPRARRPLELEGAKLPLCEWARRVGISRQALSWRIQSGKTLEDALCAGKARRRWALRLTGEVAGKKVEGKLSRPIVAKFSGALSALRAWRAKAPGCRVELLRLSGPDPIVVL